MSEALLKALLRDLGENQVLHGTAITDRYKTDWSKQIYQEPLAVVRPTCTQTVSKALKLCHEHSHPVTIQGGMTGLVGGGQVSQGEVVVSLERMQGIEEVDPDAATITVLAGTVLQVVQEAAQSQGMYFAIDLGARGSAQIGGLIATNAGGNRVIRYGMTREQVLGIEAVLADGTVISSLNKMLKNNAGYDLKQLFIGSEGTLGVITRAVLRLHPQPEKSSCALCVLPDYPAVVRFLKRTREHCNAALLAYEVMWPEFYAFMTEQVEGNDRPLVADGQMVVLMECDNGTAGLSDAAFEALLGAALDAGELVDAVIAGSVRQAQAFWRIRDSVSEFPVKLRPYASFDVSLPIGHIGEFVEQLQRQFATDMPNAQSMHYGHIGDSNLHIVVHVPESSGTFSKAAIDTIVYERVQQYGGSISAEHGIGTRKKEWLGHSRSPAEMALMRSLKQALDPSSILNPGKVI